MERKWPEMRYDVLEGLVKIHNMIVIKRATTEELVLFLEANKDELANPLYLQVFSDIIDITEEYFEESKPVCDFMYGVMQQNPDWTEVPFDFSTAIRAGAFQERYKAFLDK